MDVSYTLSFCVLIFARPDLDARATVISAELRAQSWQVTKTTPTPSSAGLTWNRACDALISGNGAVAGCSGGSSPAVGSEACRRRCGGRGAGELCGRSRARRRPRPRGGPGPSGIFFLLLDTPKPRTRLEYKMWSIRRPRIVGFFFFFGNLFTVRTKSLHRILVLCKSFLCRFLKGGYSSG